MIATILLAIRLLAVQPEPLPITADEACGEYTQCL